MPALEEHTAHRLYSKYESMCCPADAPPGSTYTVFDSFLFSATRASRSFLHFMERLYKERDMMLLLECVAREDVYTLDLLTMLAC